MNTSHLDRLIEGLRTQMVEMALKKNNFTDEEVLRLSQKLDYYLMKSQRQKMMVHKINRLRSMSTQVL